MSLELEELRKIGKLMEELMEEERRSHEERGRILREWLKLQKEIKDALKAWDTHVD
jgi:hypothetical protein